ncbi:hypothetical protein RRF57_000950 [Xylaria bambusicola]|uniref:Secreted protein n=1 Tax=Xylaria bambusicola TaxID=326684 RepID=A0AAN7UPM5_9PEZI
MPVHCKKALLGCGCRRWDRAALVLVLVLVPARTSAGGGGNGRVGWWFVRDGARFGLRFGRDEKKRAAWYFAEQRRVQRSLGPSNLRQPQPRRNSISTNTNELERMPWTIHHDDVNENAR